MESGKCVSRWASNGSGEEGAGEEEEELRVRSIEWCWLPAPIVNGGVESTLEDGQGYMAEPRRVS